MKKLIRLFILVSLAIASCKNEEPKTESTESKQLVDPKQEFAKLNEFLRKFDEPSQTFNAPTDKLIKVKGRQGTVIRINPSDLETENGQPLGKNVEIELKELTSQQQLLRAPASLRAIDEVMAPPPRCRRSRR